MTIAVYPGTFDPIHNGHIDIAKRAAAIFDHLVVGIYDRPNKNVFFTVDERVAFARDALRSCPNISVECYSDLTVAFVQRLGARVIVRGLRVISDFELEYQMAFANHKLAPSIEMVCLMTSLEYAFISSTIVKEIIRAGGSIADFVPDAVARELTRRCQINNGSI